MVEEIKSKLTLKRLYLQNFATFEKQEFSFNHGFNAIIGETGSGKSLILEALQYIIGFRAEKKSIRKGSKSAIIEAFFEFQKKSDTDFFNSIGYPLDGNSIVIKRILSKDGISKCFLNFQSCNLQTLQKVSNNYIDLVGQFENQKLLSEEYQLELLDSYARTKEIKRNYKGIYTELRNIKISLSKLKTQKDLKLQREDFIKFQIAELKNLNLQKDEEQKLINEKEQIQLRLSRSKNLTKALSLISEGENFNILNSIKLLNKNLLDGLMTKENHDKLLDFETFLSELSYDLSKSFNENESDERIQEILDRLDHIQRLKRKFRCDATELERIYLELENELIEYSKLDDTITAIESKFIEIKAKATKLANDLHCARENKALPFSSLLTKGVRALKMTGASLKFEVLKVTELDQNGITNINFIAETNPGEGYHKVKSIASGGELSRILLALRQIVSANDCISVFLFDEIDTGIGGETALCIGKSLKAVSINSQVITITHLPQIAAKADALINIKKVHKNTISGDRTVSISQLVTLKERSKFIKGMSPIH